MLGIENPLVSVVIPCYNHEKFVQDCIQSVIDQTYDNIELIIIDDGSKDNSVDKIKEMIPLCEKRFTNFEFRYRPNKGLSATLNEALEWCKGEYFSAIASDDCYTENKIFLQIKKINNNMNLVALSSNISYIDDDDNFIKDTEISNKIYSFEDIFLSNYFLPAPSTLIRIKVLREIGGYDENRVVEDWDMWLKLSKYGDVFFMEEILSLYRLHGSNTSKNIQLMNDERIKIVYKYFEHRSFNKALKNVYWINLKQSRFDNIKCFFKSGFLFLNSFIKYFFNIKV